MDVGASEKATWKGIEVFCCYARKDQSLLLELKAHLMPLQREGLITLRADIDINAGAEWEKEIHHHLNTAKMILLLVSPDFIASDYCYSIEMRRALERHERGDAKVIPIILRPVQWQNTLLGKLQALPTDARPVSKWQDRDDAFFDIAEGISKAIKKRAEKAPAKLLFQQGPRQGVGPSKPPLTLFLSKNTTRFILIMLAVILITLTLTSGGFFWSAYLQTQKTAPGGNTPKVLRSTPSFPSPASSSTPASHLPLVYRGHSQAVETLTWSPDGTLIASASADHTVQVWNAFTGKLKYSYDNYGNNVVAIDWSPDSKHLARGGTMKTIHILDSATGTLQQIFTGHTGSIWRLKWSPDNTTWPRGAAIILCASGTARGRP